MHRYTDIFISICMYTMYVYICTTISQMLKLQEVSNTEIVLLNSLKIFAKLVCTKKEKSKKRGGSFIKGG